MLLDWLITMWLGQVGCQCTCPTGLQADENSQVRLETKKTNTRGVADWMAPRKNANHQLIIAANGQKNRDRSRALDAAVEHIQKFSVGRPDLAHWPNHGPDIDRDCLDHTIPGCALLREWSKISKTRTHLYASTCLYAAGRKEGE